MTIRFVLLIAVAAALPACTTGIYQPGFPAGSPVPGPTTSAPGTTRGTSTGAGAELPDTSSQLSGATAALLDQSRGERNAGDLDAAAATVERALAIAPDAAALWVELAEIHWERGDLDLAEEVARKALTLTPAGSREAERARRLISR